MLEIQQTQNNLIIELLTWHIVYLMYWSTYK